MAAIGPAISAVPGEFAVTSYFPFAVITTRRHRVPVITSVGHTVQPRAVRGLRIRSVVDSIFMLVSVTMVHRDRGAFTPLVDDAVRFGATRYECMRHILGSVALGRGAGLQQQRFMLLPSLDFFSLGSP